MGREWELSGSGSRLCTEAGFGIGGIETLLLEDLLLICLTLKLQDLSTHTLWFYVNWTRLLSFVKPDGLCSFS